MAIHFNLPTAIEQALRDRLGDISAKAKEAFLVTVYREGKLSHPALSRALGLDRFETEELLHEYNAVAARITADAHNADGRAIEAIRNFCTLTQA